MKKDNIYTIILKLRSEYMKDNPSTPNCLILSHDMYENLILWLRENLNFYDYIDGLEKVYMGLEIYEVDGENIIKVGFVK